MSGTDITIDPLTILLSRAARGVLLPEEGDRLRTIVGKLKTERDQHAATIARVRTWAHEELRYNDRTELLHVIDHPAPQPTVPPVHLAKGCNAETCPACCAGPTPDYPWICPGPTA